jgi:hypothetical protein
MSTLAVERDQDDLSFDDGAVIDAAEYERIMRRVNGTAAGDARVSAFNSSI